MARFHYKFGLAERTLIRSTGKTRKLYKYKNNYTLKNLSDNSQKKLTLEEIIKQLS